MAKLKRGLIASCQAVKGEPLYGYNIMHLMANACVEGGACGIRCNYVEDIKSIKNTVHVPIIGIIKAVYEDSEVYITPTLKEVKELIEVGPDVIALDCTNRVRPNNEKLEDLVKYIRDNSNIEIMADTDDYAGAKIAYELGFDYIGTTMRGYTKNTKGISIPDYDYLSNLVSMYPNTKIIAEGGIWELSQLEKVCECNPYSIVIGSAITRPKDITKRFVERINLK